MTKASTGRARLVIKDAADREKHISPEFDVTVLDNTGSPRIYLNAAAQATQADQREFWRNAILSGKAGHILELQYFDGTKITLDTSDMVFELPGVKAIRLPEGGVEQVSAHLSLRDRITKDSTANPDPRGLNDDGDTVANEWSPVLRFAIRPGESFTPSGHFRAEIHDNV